jgi:hypothetical protein
LGALLLFFFFQFCDGTTSATIISEDSTNISYRISRNLRFFFSKMLLQLFQFASEQRV